MFDFFMLTTEGQQTGSLLANILIIAVPLAVFYFLLIRPQKKREKQTAAMRNSIIVGDQVTTIGGVVGRVVSIKDEIITIETGADRNKLSFQRWAIQSKDTKPAEETK